MSTQQEEQILVIIVELVDIIHLLSNHLVVFVMRASIIQMKARHLAVTVALATIVKEVVLEQHVETVLIHFR